MYRPIAVLLLVFLVASCSTNQSKVIIDFVAHSSQEDRYKPLIDEFNSLNPDIEVRFVGVGNDVDREQKMQKGDVSVTEYVSEADYQNGLVLDLHQFIEKDLLFDKSDYYAGALEMMTSGDSVFAVPEMLSLPLMHYNKNIRNSGVLSDSKNVYSWDAFFGAVSEISRYRNGATSIYGLADEGPGYLTIQAEISTSDSSYILLASYQGKPINTPGVKRAIESTLAMMNSGVIYTRIQSNAKGQDMRTLIEKQKILVWPSYMFSFEDRPVEHGLKIGTIPYPESLFQDMTSVSNFVISKETRCPAESWRWLAFLSRQVIDQHSSIKPHLVARLPARKSIAALLNIDGQLDTEAIAAREVLMQRLAKSIKPPINVNNVLLIGDVLSKVKNDGVSIDKALSDGQHLLRVP